VKGRWCNYFLFALRPGTSPELVRIDENEKEPVSTGSFSFSGNY
jgi:hypothetical protein